MSARTCYFKGDFDYKSPLWRTKVSFSQPLMNIFACGLFSHKGLVHLHTMSGLLHLQLSTYREDAENKSATPPLREGSQYLPSFVNATLVKFLLPFSIERVSFLVDLPRMLKNRKNVQLKCV